MNPFFFAGAAAYGLAMGGMSLIQRSLVYYPNPMRPEPANWGAPDMAVVRTTTDDGLTIEGWYAPPSAGDGLVVVTFHGNAGHVGFRAFKAQTVIRKGHGAYLAGYRGFGGNPGSPTEDGLMADGRAQLRQLEAQGIGSDRLVLYGESLGNGVAIRLARELADLGRPVRGLILETPYTSLPDVAQHHYPLLPMQYLMADRFDASDHIAHVGTPILVLHGDADDIVPIRFGRRILDAAQHPKEGVFFTGGQHNDLWERGAAQATLAFLDRLQASPGR